MIAMISDEKNENIGTMLKERLCRYREDIVFISASEKNLKPCYSCGGCENKSFGKCVVRDDMDNILPVLARADAWIFTSPVTWGGPSYAIKKILDKSALLGNRFYKVKKGELVKGVIGGVKRLALIGVDEKSNSRKAQDFIAWGNKVVNIMDLSGIVKVLDEKSSEAEVDRLAEELTQL